MKELSAGSLHCNTIAACCASLLDFYALLDADTWDAKAGAAACRKFCIMYAALSREAPDENLWRMKPKMYIVQELAEYQGFELGHPGKYWTYQDESFVGEVANMATSRGGPRAAATTARLTLTKFSVLS